MERDKAEGPSSQPARRVTTIGSKPEANRALQPTAIPSQASTAASGTQKKPTVIEPRATEPGPVKAETPTAIQGTTRKRIPANLSDLRGHAGNATEETLEMALHLVLTFTVEEPDDAKYVMWGQQTQQDYGAFVSKCLEMSQSVSLQHANTRVSRLQEVLAEIDLERLLDIGTNIVAKIRGNTREKVLEDFASIQSEIMLLIEGLKNDIPKLLELKKEFTQVKDKLRAITSKLQAETIAAEFVAGYMRKSGLSGFGRHAEILEGRCMSLTSTLAQIWNSSSMFDIQVDHPLQLISCIQDTALIQVPSWLGSYVSLRTMIEGNAKLTKTHISETGQQLKQLIQSFRKS